MTSGPDSVSKDKNEGLRTPFPGAEPPAAKEVGPRKEDWIGRQLRRVFDDALAEPLPDDIMSLLESIDSKIATKAAPDGEPT
ncbi:NepR family anti-sigma factor [Prosthecomicrobium pneumaticum]|uniref:Anti-sigma factor NepR domain-containing protein n=1 Tax=Prosthecomicrobium pneumaticum TaxID=81895 RepID=A0A7W9L2A0_9HYPH|nr:NepR family anti-sigma factor [Prosthecomicrobium pneumaticum]MBB5753293.1 hypothetical protein [Prosthecomicrobium pneumaticum]